MKNKIITLILVFSLLVPTLSYAQTVPFGGRIIGMHECFCSGGWMIYVYDTYTNATLPILFQFGVSRINMWYNIFTYGVQTLGSYTPGGSCTLASTSCYVTIPAAGTVTSFPMSGIGTSLIPWF